MKSNTFVMAALATGLAFSSFANAGVIASQTINSTVIGAKQGKIPASASLHDLEAVLKEYYIGTYAIYGTLPEQKKQALFASVKNGGNIQEFRQQVIEMRLNK